jgi:hypothetical protein
MCPQHPSRCAFLYWDFWALSMTMGAAETYIYDYHVRKICGSHSSGHAKCYLLRYNTVYSAESQPMFPRNILTPSLGPNELSMWPAVFTLVSCLAYFTLEVEVIRSSKTSVDFNGLHGVYPRRSCSSCITQANDFPCLHFYRTWRMRQPKERCGWTIAHSLMNTQHVHCI